MEVGHETRLNLFQQNLFLNSRSLSVSRALSLSFSLRGGETNNTGEFWQAAFFSPL